MNVSDKRGSIPDRVPYSRHQALPNIVRALYTGQNRGAVLGSGPRRDSDWRLTDAKALEYVNVLQKDRKYADYGHGTTAEPYGVRIVDERLAWAHRLVEDLSTLL